MSLDLTALTLAKKYTDKQIIESSGVAPSIRDGYWYIGEVNTNVRAEGITPHIGENNNWFIGDLDTGINAKLDVEIDEEVTQNSEKLITSGAVFSALQNISSGGNTPGDISYDDLKDKPFYEKNIINITNIDAYANIDNEIILNEDDDIELAQQIINGEIEPAFQVTYDDKDGWIQNFTVKYPSTFYGYYANLTFTVSIVNNKAIYKLLIQHGMDGVREGHSIDVHANIINPLDNKYISVDTWNGIQTKINESIENTDFSNYISLSYDDLTNKPFYEKIYFKQDYMPIFNLREGERIILCTIDYDDYIMGKGWGGQRTTITFKYPSTPEEYIKEQGWFHGTYTIIGDRLILGDDQGSLILDHQGFWSDEENRRKYQVILDLSELSVPHDYLEYMDVTNSNLITIDEKFLPDIGKIVDKELANLVLDYNDLINKPVEEIATIYSINNTGSLIVNDEIKTSEDTDLSKFILNGYHATIHFTDPLTNISHRFEKILSGYYLETDTGWERQYYLSCGQYGSISFTSTAERVGNGNIRYKLTKSFNLIKNPSDASVIISNIKHLDNSFVNIDWFQDNIAEISQNAIIDNEMVEKTLSVDYNNLKNKPVYDDSLYEIGPINMITQDFSIETDLEDLAHDIDMETGTSLTSPSCLNIITNLIIDKGSGYNQENNYQILKIPFDEIFQNEPVNHYTIFSHKEYGDIGLTLSSQKPYLNSISVSLNYASLSPEIKTYSTATLYTDIYLERKLDNYFISDETWGQVQNMIDESIENTKEIYVGSGEVPQNVDIQIDPTEDAFGIDNLATIEYVNTAIANALGVIENGSY